MNAKYSFKKESVIYLIILIPFIVIYYFWNDLPENMPMHWNFAGEVDRWGSKNGEFIFMPFINIIMYFLFLILPKIDPKRRNYSLFSGAYYTIRLLLHLLISSLLIVTVAYCLNYKVDIASFVIYGLLIMFTLMGNVLGNVRFNYTLGIRSPWTLASEEVWRKTHRMASRLWVAASLISIFAGILLGGEMIKYIFIANTALISIVPVVYSYIVFKKLKLQNGE